MIRNPNKAGAEAIAAIKSAELAVFQKAALEGVPVYAVKDSYSAISVEEEREMSQIIEELLQTWMESRDKS